MDLSKLRSLTNSYQDVRLVSLRTWRAASEINPRDHGGPYIVQQEGYDPADLSPTHDEFVLGRSGRWVSLSIFFKQPTAERRQEFVFGTAAEVMQLLERLPSKPNVVRPGKALESAEEAAPVQDDLNTAFLQASRAGKPKPEA